MDVDQLEHTALAGYGLVMTADALLGLLGDGGQWSGVVLVGSLVILGGAVIQLHNDTEADRPRLSAYVGILAFVLATAGFVLGLV